MSRMTREEEARKQESKRVLERYYFYRDRGICPVCGRNDARIGHVYCEDCIKHRQEQELKRDPGHEKRKATERKQYEERVAAGLCADCGKPTRNGFKRCNKCLDNARWRTKIWSLKKKFAEQKQGGNKA